MNRFQKTIIQTLAAMLVLLPLSGTGLTGTAPIQAASVQKTPQVAGLNHTSIKKHNVVYFPLKDVCDLLDLQVKWNSNNRLTEVTGITQYARITIGKSKVQTKNGKVVSLGSAPFVKNGVTYVPESLFSKVFSLPVKWKSKTEVSLTYEQKYIKSSVGNTLFWIHKPAGVLYTGISGHTPKKSGTINSRELDWVSVKARQAAKDSYVLDINNSHGEPHIHNEDIRAIVYQGKLVKQSTMSYSYMGPDFYGYVYPNALSEGNHFLLNNGHRAELVTPEGQVVESFNLDRIAGTTGEIYSVEVIQPEFLLIRQFTTGDLMLVNRATGDKSVLYKQLFDEATAAKIEKREADYYGYRLIYKGRSDQILKFEWKKDSDAKGTILTYKLPF